MRTLFSFIILGAFCFTTSYAGVAPAKLTCEYMENPLAVESPAPRFSWILLSQERDQVQSGYRILVASSISNLAGDIGDLWDSGYVSSNRQSLVSYAGKKLVSGQQYFWKVKTWDGGGKASSWSEPAWWQMALLNNNDWQASWISTPQNPDGRGIWFRKEFNVHRPVKKATAYVCGLGQFELFINGEKTGDYVMAPEWTNYRKTCSYLTFNVTEQLKEKNAVAVMLGNGMYNVLAGRYTKFTGSFGQPKLIFQLNIKLEDGSTKIITSDGSWKSGLSPITFTSIYGGEDYDARLEQPGWASAGFDDANWEPAAEVNGPGGRLTAQISPPIKVIESLEPVAVSEPRAGIFVYDLGRNFAGWPAISVKGKRGSRVKLVPGELLEPDGLVSQRGSGGPVSFNYTLKGGGLEAWAPRFSYYGFRYLQVEGASPDSAELSDSVAFLEQVQGRCISSSSATVGHFECSNPLLNDIHRIITAAMRSNMQSLFTDSPHREKLGWLEQTHLLGRSLLFNYDLARLFSKSISDMRDAQLETGLIPSIAPEYVVFNGGFRDSPEWGSAYVIDPWHLYTFYGDQRILRDNYEGMKKYVTYLLSRTSEKILYYGLGDWYDIGPGSPGVSKLTPAGLTATAILLQDLNILARTAGLLNKRDDAKLFQNLFEEHQAAFNEKFFNADSSAYAGNSQTANAMPLALGLVEQSRKESVLSQLIKDIQKRHNHITAGDVGHMYVLDALAQNNRSDIIFDLLSRTDAPSYGYQIKKGATTLTEAWDADKNSSQNHFMLGHIEQWFYEGLGGIRPSEDPAGFAHIVIAPQVVGDLTWAKTSYRSLKGVVSSNWRLQDSLFSLEVSIPPNTTARVVLPTAAAESITESGNPVDTSRITARDAQTVSLSIGSGNYTFTADFEPPAHPGPPSRKFVHLPEITPGDTLVYIPNTIRVSMRSATIGAHIHYSLDGSEPDESSLLYAGPFEVDRPVSIRARAFKQNYNPSFATEPVSCSFVNAEDNGLEYSYYEGEWKTLPDFDSLTPVRKGKTYLLNHLDPAPREDHYSVEYKSFIQLEKGGRYTFYLRSDDGSRLYIDNTLVIDNDGTHGIKEKSATKTFAAGRHPIKLQYFEDLAGEHLELLYQGPGIARQKIPPHLYFYPQDQKRKAGAR